MQNLSIQEWLDRDSEIPPKPFRQAVHTILLAISMSCKLRELMVMKGAILMSLKYGLTRYTKDIDYSTALKYQDFDEEKFLHEFVSSLTQAVETLDYNLDCLIQTHKIKPQNEPNASFPTLHISIGYAKKGTNSHKRLLAKRGTDVVSIDFSFNEVTKRIEEIEISEHGTIQAYSLTDLIAEKYRAILQQEIRNRERRQDVYDIFIFSNIIMMSCMMIFGMKYLKA